MSQCLACVSEIRRGFRSVRVVSRAERTGGVDLTNKTFCHLSRGVLCYGMDI